MELRQIQINAATPGYTATDLNAGRGNRTVEEGTRAIVAMATLDDTAPPERSSTTRDHCPGKCTDGRPRYLTGEGIASRCR
jgi:hypothetical protein